MGNVQYWQDYNVLLVFMPAPAYVLTFAPIALGQVLLLDHIMLMEETTAIPAMRVRKVIGGDTVVLWEKASPIVNQWVEVEMLVQVNENESLQLVWIGTVVMDTLDYYVQGRLALKAAWEEGRVK